MADTVRRETAFDLENQGVTGSRLSEAVDGIIRDSPFHERSCQAPNTLSGGEQQLLAITAALQQPHEFLVGRHCFDFLSTRNMQLIEEHIVGHEKRMLAVTYHANMPGHEQSSMWRINGEQLEELTKTEMEASLPEWQADIPQWRLIAAGVEKTFETSGFALLIPDLVIDKIRCLGIFGENGSGKSTLADCLTGIEVYAGSLTAAIPGTESPKLGYLVQKTGNLSQGLSIKDILQRFIDHERISRLDGGRIEQMLNDLPEYQALAVQDARLGFRLVIVAALFAGDYDLVILDEPTYGLPTWAVANFLIRTIEEWGAKPLAIISHNRNFLAFFCDRIIQMENGTVHEADF
ncbi:MAG: ATP-binding cassette domain-containing protein [Fidelibacterota bacterium]|nr:MAG: ATP-binding cassette domain-containing protein [Candidatus Neomarinimicrobiota bacterium]